MRETIEANPRLPFNEVECPCLICGRMVLRPKKRAGRHARFCSSECRATAMARWTAKWRVKQLAKGGGLKVRKSRGGGPVGAFAPKISELNTESHLGGSVLQIACVQCGASFADTRSGCGRMPRFCSRPCRRAQIFDREVATVEVSTEDSDNFRKNLVTLRGEERLAFVIKHPDAFVKGDFSDALAA